MARPASQTSRIHAVRFYRDFAGLGDVVAAFIDEGLTSANPAIVMATPSHRAVLEQKLRATGHDIDDLKKWGRFVCVDAEATLARCCVAGAPDWDAFLKAIKPLVEKASRIRPGAVVRAYGEMMDLLWQRGESAAACRLETFWNSLARSFPVSLLCGYSIETPSGRPGVGDICGHHSHVLSARGLPARIV